MVKYIAKHKHIPRNGGEIECYNLYILPHMKQPENF